MTNDEMSRDHIEAMVKIQDESFEQIAYQEMPTASGRFRVVVLTYDSQPGPATKEEVRELVEVLIGTARVLEGLT